MFAACAWYEPRDKSWQILWRIKEFKHNKLNFISEHLQPSPTLVCTVYALIHILSTRTTEEYHFGKMYWKVLNWTRYLFWLVVSTPQKNISQLGWLFPIYGKIKKNVPNHQPDIYCLHNKPKRRRHFAQRPGTYPRHWRIPGTALAGLVPPPSSPAVGPDQLAFSLAFLFLHCFTKRSAWIYIESCRCFV